MKYLLICLLLTLPIAAQAAYVSGVDDAAGDRKANIPPEVQAALDHAILTYYQAPSIEKIDTILDTIADSPLLERKTAWAPLVGFLTVVFPANKNHVMAWISRNDYNTYAQYVIVNALMHAKMKETAMLFAKANSWSDEDLYQLRETTDQVDMKKLVIAVPGHIDTLWGAFFASGDTTYIDLIIEHMLNGKIPDHAAEAFLIPEGDDPLGENKVLAATTLRDYARDHKPVRQDLEKRYKEEPDDSPKKKLYKEILGQ